MKKMKKRKKRKKRKKTTTVTVTSRMATRRSSSLDHSNLPYPKGTLNSIGITSLSTRTAGRQQGGP